MTPGEYIRKRRVAQAMTMDEAIAACACVGPLSAPLSAMEDGSAPIMLADVSVLCAGIDIPVDVLADVACSMEIEICESCGCSHYDPCFDADEQPCSWHRPGLCSTCVEGYADPEAPTAIRADPVPNTNLSAPCAPETSA